MSAKDVIKYYEQVCEQMKELEDNIKDFEDAASKNIFSPERVEEYKNSVAKFKANYERISYIVFLLNQPVKKSKVKGYEQRNKKLLSKLSKDNSLDAQLKENAEVIEKTKVEH